MSEATYTYKTEADFKMRCHIGLQLNLSQNCSMQVPAGNYLMVICSRNKTWAVREDTSIQGDAPGIIEDIRTNPSGIPLLDAAAIEIIRAVVGLPKEVVE